MDDFYENPDEIREIGLNAKYGDADGCRPGKASVALNGTHPVLHKKFTDKIFSLFYSEKTYVKCFVSSFFQLTETNDPNPNSIKNVPWIHRDDDCIFAGVIYLNKVPLKNGGTSIYSLKEGQVWNEEKDGYTFRDKPRFEFFADNYDEESYTSRVNDRNNRFEESIRFENKYNRMICYPGSNFHACHSFYREDGQQRLIQIFFVKSIESDSKYPLVRLPKVKL